MHLLDDGRHVGGRCRSRVHDKVSVNRRNLGPADRKTLQSTVLDHLAHTHVVRILKDRAAACAAERLRLAPAIERLLHNLADLTLLARSEFDRGLEHDLVARQGARAIPPLHVVVCVMPETRARFEREDVLHHAADAPLARAGVHGDGAAERAGDSHGKLEAREPARERLVDEPRQNHAGAHGERDAVLRNDHARELAPERDHRATIALVCHEQV